MKTFDYIYGAHLGELILSHSDNLGKTLQNPKLSAVQGQDCAHKTVITLERIRNEESWNLLWDAVVAKATQLGADDPKLPRRRNAPKTMMNDYFGYGEGEATHPETPQDMYRKHYYEALDLVINCIKDRFDQKDYKVYATLQDVLLKAVKKESFDAELDAVPSFYASDFDPSLLKTQLATFSADFPQITDLNFNDVHKYLQGLHSGMRTLLSQVFHPAKLILVCPAINATSGRSFGALRRVKNYLQSTMGQVRMNNIMVMHVHKDRIDKLSLVDAANDFVSGSEARLSIFGVFQLTDLKRSQVMVKTKAVQVCSI